MRLNLACTAVASVRTERVLASSGHSLQQHMTIGKQTDQQAIHQLFLADNHVGNFLAQRPGSMRPFVQPGLSAENSCPGESNPPPTADSSARCK